jgi:hypothetical protein
VPAGKFAVGVLAGWEGVEANVKQMRQYAASFSLPFVPLGPMQAGMGWKSNAGGVVAAEMVEFVYWWGKGMSSQTASR